jgi:DNA-binding MarR family transcriptional regulator
VPRLSLATSAHQPRRQSSTVSRQISKLENLGLVARVVDAADARVTQAQITAKGRTITKALDGAREKLMIALLATWDKKEVAELARLLRRLADDALKFGRAVGVAR